MVADLFELTLVVAVDELEQVIVGVLCGGQLMNAHG